jgi:uncharacterized repeat protein (TIGR01451 family)
MKNPTSLLCAALQVALALFAACIAPHALGAGVEITNQAMREVEQKGLDGTTSVKLAEMKSATPGERVRFVIQVHNGSTRPAEKLVVTNPVPSDVEFQSASEGAEVSVDGGKTFGALAQLTVKPTAGTPRAAQFADVTHVRWRLASSVPAGADSEVYFAGRIK